MKGSVSYINKALDIFHLVASNSFVSELHESIRSVEAPEAALVHCKDIKCETSASDSQDIKEQISTSDSQDIKKQIPTNDSQDITLIPEVLVSFYDSPNKYLIVEDVQKGVERYISKRSVDFNDFHIQPKKSESNEFAIYQEVFVKMKEREKAKMKYFCKLSISQVESDDHGSIYYLNESFKCLICRKKLKASFNILGNRKTLMIDQIKNDYLLPYQQDVAGLVHRKCKPQENLNCDGDNNHYRCSLSSERKLKKPVNTQHQLCMSILILLLLLSPIFLNLLIYNLPGNAIFYGGIWIIVYCILFVVLAINELFRYCKKTHAMVRRIYLIVWSAQFNSLPVNKLHIK